MTYPLLFAALVLAGSGSAVQCRQLMEVGEKINNRIIVLSISCDGREPDIKCSIAGSQIYKSEKKPAFAIGDPKDTCYLEAALNENQKYERHGKLLISKEGPDGSMCMNQLITTIDFSSHTYTSRKFSDIRTEDFCKAQTDEIHNYTQSAISAPQTDLKCSSIEYLPSMWAP